MDNQRNLILAIVLSAVLLFGWDAAVRYFYPQANKPRPVASAPAASATQVAPSSAVNASAGVSTGPKDLRTALGSGGRIPIAAPGLSGSINTTGAVIDDLTLNRHRAALKKNSGAVRLFAPAGTPDQQFAQFGWVGDNLQLPGSTTQWAAPAGARLTPQTPVTLRWTSPAGQMFTITFRIDRDYMITAKQTVANTGAAPVAMRPFALIARTDRNADVDSFNVHSGPIGGFGGAVQFGPDYGDLAEAGTGSGEGRADWIGFTDIYWMSALIPQGAPASSGFRSLGGRLYRADLIYPTTTIPPGRQVTRSTRLFAGAKESEVLDRYEDGGVVNFGLAIDWGWFRWFEKPIFWLLRSLFELVGNFGVAIILLTVIVRGVMFPIAQRQFASMAAMRAIQPKMKALQERYKDDKQKQQQEIMDLYKKEKVNPLAGCLPIFLQIPIFFALYKVLILAIEMRHQPFALWIKDLSAPDPLHLLNLFGLLPFTPPSFLAIGMLAVLLGITMWLQFRLNPAPMDPVQQQMFAIMPWLMMFIMAPFAAGLLLYWITSNVLTIAQQAYLYSKHPQLKAQQEKDAVDGARAAARAKK